MYEAFTLGISILAFLFGHYAGKKGKVKWVTHATAEETISLVEEVAVTARDVVQMEMCAGVEAAFGTNASLHLAKTMAKEGLAASSVEQYMVAVMQQMAKKHGISIETLRKM